MGKKKPPRVVAIHYRVPQSLSKVVKVKKKEKKPRVVKVRSLNPSLFYF